MGQEQSYAHASATQVRRYKQNEYLDPVRYRDTTGEYRAGVDYRRHRRGASLKSDSTDSSGYKSETNSGYDYRPTSDDCRLSLYKNDHYRDQSKELYKPVKIKEKRHIIHLLDTDKIDSNKHTKTTSYLTNTEKSNLKTNTTKSGIRNYTPKILSEEEKRKELDNWL